MKIGLFKAEKLYLEIGLIEVKRGIFFNQNHINIKPVTSHLNCPSYNVMEAIKIETTFQFV